MLTIKSVFDHYLKHVKIDNNWVKEFNNYLTSVMVKNEDTVSFFGSIMVGVHKVHFDIGDLNYIWDILVEADRDEVRGALHATKYINPKWQVGADVTNHLLIYLVHRVLTSNLPVKVKDNTTINLLFLLHYKFVTSLLKRDYPYQVDQELALTVYNKLSRRFILRQVDSWKELLTTHSTNMYFGEGKRKAVQAGLIKYNSDQFIVETITGVSTNLNSMFKEYNRVFHSVKDESDRIGLDSKLGTDSEGTVSFKDNLTNPIRYQYYLESHISNLDTFINDELLKVIVSSNKARYKPVRKALVYIAGNYGVRRQEKIKELVDTSLHYGLRRLSEHELDNRNIRKVFDILIGVFSSSRSLDAELEVIKKIGEEVINNALGGKSHGNTITLTRTTLVTYIVIWTLLNK